MKQAKNSAMLQELPSVVKSCDALRKNVRLPREVEFSQFVKQKYNMDMPQYLEELGVEPHIDTIQNLYTSSDVDSSYRWLVPEIILAAVRLGLRKNPIWSDLIISEQPVSQTTVKMPWWNMSDATPEYVGEAETIPLGSVSFGEKELSIRKMGKGIKVPYEVQQYVAVNVVSIFLSDFGVKLNQGITNLLINVLINGEQTNGSESAPVIGVDSTATGITYKDMLRLWIRLSRIGRNATKILGGEVAANDILNLSEFKDRNQGTPDKTLNLKTPVPTEADFYVHGNIPDDQLIVIDRTSAVLKFNAQPLLVETEKIVSNQTSATYATLTTGFGIVYRDARAILDGSEAFSSTGFPAFMDIDAAEDVQITD